MLEAVGTLTRYDECDKKSYEYNYSVLMDLRLMMVSCRRFIENEN